MSENDADALADSLAEALTAQRDLQAFIASRRLSADEWIDQFLATEALRNQYPMAPSCHQPPRSSGEHA